MLHTEDFKCVIYIEIFDAYQSYTPNYSIKLCDYSGIYTYNMFPLCVAKEHPASM
jgi:hypothetical protein